MSGAAAGTQRLWSGPRAWWVLWIALAVMLVVRTGIRDRGAITDHLEFGHRVLTGGDLYAPYLEAKPLDPPYPPGFGLLTAPFSLLPERLARFAWGLLQVGALLWIGVWLKDAIARSAPALLPRIHVLLAIVAVLAGRFVLRDTHGGGGNLINLAMVLGSFALARTERPYLAGVVLGFSLATKPTAVLMLPLLWLFGRTRAAVTAVLAAAAFTGIALLLLGQGLAPFERWLEGSLAYARMPDVFATPAYGFPEFTWMNQCLRCASARYLGTVPAEQAALIPGFFPGLGLAPAVIAWVTRAIATVLLAITAMVGWRSRAVIAARPALIGAVLALSLLLSPISWKAHHVALIPAFLVLLASGLSGRRSLLAVLAAYALITMAGEDLTGKAFKELQQSLYVFTAGDVLLWGLCLIEAERTARGARDGLSPPAAARYPASPSVSR